MEKNRPKSKRDVSVEQHLRRLHRFFETHGSELESPLDPSQQAPAFGKVGRMLSKAIEVNEPAVFSLIVQVWLIRKGFEPPKGVFIPDLHHGRPGRKRKADEQFRVWSSYNTMNNPTFGKVAKKVFPKEFSQDQKRAADRTRQLYRSYEKHSDAALREAIRKFVSSKGTPGEENSK